MIPSVRLTLKQDSIIPIHQKTIYGCEEAVPIFQNRIGDCARECVGLICLDANNRILNYSDINLGMTDKVPVDLAVLFKTILLSNASSIVIGHNHPSSIIKPSANDVEMTKKINELCLIFGIKLIDSIIVGPTKEFYSLRSNI
ncbi:MULTISPECIES: JAB domain-containing protein [unclassified Exiguobacterium]|uniref:JAB domain-containing protein n=1 Tax=unclassified Exiguobacterium TaxID=2644629 RepID=UPI001BE93FAD|nr:MULTISPECIES: JAB domain-containing protein [unclassified Exiguobacterium]